MRVGIPLLLTALAACGREESASPPVPPTPAPPVTSGPPVVPSKAEPPALPAAKPDPLKRAFEDLNSPDPSRRLAAIAALESLGPDAAPALPALLALLENEDEGSAAAKTIAAIGEPAVSPVSRLLTHARSGMRWRAASIVGIWGPRAMTAVPALFEALESASEDPNEPLTQEYLAALRSVGRVAVAHAVDAISRGTWSESRAAIQFLGSLETADPDALAGLIRAERHPNPKLRDWAALSRRRLQSLVRPVAETKALLKSPDRTVLMATVQALASTGTVMKEVLPELLDLLKRNVGAPYVEKAIVRIGPGAFDSLADMLRTEDPVLASNLPSLILRLRVPPGQVIPRMLEILTSGPPRGRGAALMVLTHMGPSAVAAVPGVERLIRSGDEHLKMAAANFYTATQSPEGVRALAGLLKDPSFQVRQQAAMSLNAMRGPVFLAEPEVNELLRDARLSHHAENVLKKIRAAKEAPTPPARDESSPKTDAVRAAIDRLDGPDPGVRRAAAAELGLARADAGRVVPALLGAAQAEDPDVRRAAARALVALGAPAIPKLAESLARAPQFTMPSNILALIGPRAADVVPTLLKAHLRAPREMSLRVFRNIGKAAVPALLLEMKNSDAFIAAAAAKALGEIGAEAADALPALEEAAAAVPPKRLQREARIAALRVRAHSLSPSETAGRIIPDLSHADLGTRNAAFEAVILLGPRAEGVLPALLDLLKTGPMPEVSAAFRGIGRPAYLALVRALDTQDRKLAAAAVGVLKGMEAPREAVPELAKLLKHPSASTRADALAVLAETAPLAQALTEEITLLLKAENPEVRGGAVRFLAAYAPDPAVALLAPLLKDPTPDVRIQTARSLQDMKERGVSLAPARAALREALLDDALKPLVRSIQPE